MLTGTIPIQLLLLGKWLEMSYGTRRLTEQKASREVLIERSLLGKAVSKKEWATGLFPLRATTARIYSFRMYSGEKGISSQS